MPRLEENTRRMTETEVLNQILNVAILHIEPGDAIAIRSLRRLTTEQAERIREQVRSMLPEHPILILPPELEIETIIRKADIP